MTIPTAILLGFVAGWAFTSAIDWLAALNPIREPETASEYHYNKED